MNPKVVFFGEADYGKSTVIGYLYAESQNIDMDKIEKQLKKKIGTDYNSAILYSSLINTDVLRSITEQKVQIQELADDPHVVEGNKIIKDNMDETIIESTSITGTTVKIITTTHKKGRVERLNSRNYHIRNFEIDGLKIILVDTPGHAAFISGREYGISMGDIGVFCLAIHKVLDDDFDEVMLGFTDLWKEYKSNEKIIYLLTQFDRKEYRESDFREACERIRRLCKLVNVTYEDNVFGLSIPFDVEEKDAAAIIPVAIDFNNRQGINLTSLSEKTPWYYGQTLIEAIRERMDKLPRDYSKNDDLLFSIDKEIANPRSKAGKVWRIHLRNGILGVDNKIILTSVNIDGYPKSETFSVEGTVKSIRNELHYTEDAVDTTTAYRGSIVTIDLKDCYVNRKKINKRDIQITKESIGIASGKALNYHDELYIKFLDAEKAFDVVRVGQDIVLLWFGKRVSAKVMKIPDSIEGMYVKILHNKKLSIPFNPELRNIEALRNIKIFVQHGGKYWYISGLFDFDKSR